MAVVELVLPTGGARVWHGELARQLRLAGHVVQLAFGAREQASFMLAEVLQMEAWLFGKQGPWMASLEPCDATLCPLAPDIIVALAQSSRPAPGVQLTLAPGSPEPMTAQWAAEIAGGGLPDISLYDDADCIARAYPMIDNRQSVAKGLEDVLARAITLTVETIRAVLGGEQRALPPALLRPSLPFLPTYLTRSLPRLGAEVLRRRRFHKAHWRVGYRMIEGPGVAQAADLGGQTWNVLPDDGARFYADPFPFEWEGNYYIFVEDLEHARGKAVISVTRLDKDGLASSPQPVLEEAHHLSYPQVFSREGQVWMLPEASSGRELVLYRAEEFPTRWSRHAVLVGGRALSDATLLEHDGRLWLLATDATEGGSTSDTLVVFHATCLTGPWQAHQHNPILIDRRSARPGGAVIRSAEALLLPVQDGTQGYGGGLGLAEILELTPDLVRLGSPRPIRAEGFWPYPKIHTLNRAGRLEVVDGIAEVRRV